MTKPPNPLEWYEKHPAFASIILTASGYFMFTIVDAMSKFLTSQMDVLNIIMWSALHCLIVLVIFSLFAKDPHHVYKTKDWSLYILKGTLAFFSIYLVIFSLKEIPLTQFYSIFFISPLLASTLSKVFFKDRFTLKHLLALLAGFMGVLLTTRPDIQTLSMGSMACGLASVTYALSLLTARGINKKDSKLLFGLTTYTVLFVYSLVLLLIQGSIVVPTGGAHILFILIGVLASLANVFVSTGYQIAPSVSIVAPFHYTQIFWGSMIGYMIWGEVPTPSTILGSLVIILSGLWIIYTEHNSSKNNSLHRS